MNGHQFSFGELILRFQLFLILPVLFFPQEAFASAVIEQRQQQMRQQQQEAIRQQQQAIHQQQQAYQQAVIRRQQTERQAYEQALQQRALVQQAYNKAAQEGLRNIQQQQQAVFQSVETPAIQAPTYGNLFYEPPVAEVVNITDIWDQMEHNSHSWRLMIDMEPKALTIQRMIERLGSQDIRIRKAPAHYVQIIDTMAFQNPQLLDQPFEDILKVVAIVEYDFDNGQNKDALARQIFTDEKSFLEKKKRLGF
jgi:exonuclease VII large subunit